VGKIYWRLTVYRIIPVFSYLAGRRRILAPPLSDSESIVDGNYFYGFKALVEAMAI